MLNSIFKIEIIFKKIKSTLREEENEILRKTKAVGGRDIEKIKKDYNRII